MRAILDVLSLAPNPTILPCQMHFAIEHHTILISLTRSVGLGSQSQEPAGPRIRAGELD